MLVLSIIALVISLLTGALNIADERNDWALIMLLCSAANGIFVGMNLMK